MAKTKSSGESKSAVFKRIFLTHKNLLSVPSIAEVIKLFEAQVGREATNNDRNIAANIKSKMRKKMGLRGHRKKKRTVGVTSVNGGHVAVAAPRTTSSFLALEDAIDDCIFLARKMESDQLTDIVRMLRKVRDQLIVMAAK